jgi:PPOX class probable F420-dependent enzyme
VLDGEQREFVEARRTATLVTTSRSGLPRPVPICFVLGEPDRESGPTALYSPLDEKRKSSADVRALARVRDIAARPSVTLLFERWSEDWSRLAWLRARGSALLLEPGDGIGRHRWAVEALRNKYPQYRTHRIETSPMIRVVIDEVASWSAATGRI